MWIDLSRPPRNNTWIWSGGTFLKAEHWRSGEPKIDEHCVKSEKSARFLEWESDRCDDNHRVACLNLSERKMHKQFKIIYCTDTGRRWFYHSEDSPVSVCIDEVLFQASLIMVTRREACWSQCVSGVLQISAQLSSRAFHRSIIFYKGPSILLTARPNSSQMCSKWLHLEYIIGCPILRKLGCNNPGTMMRVIFLIANVVLEILPGKWQHCILQSVSVLYNIYMCVSAIWMILNNCECESMFQQYLSMDDWEWIHCLVSNSRETARAQVGGGSISQWCKITHIALS